MGGVGSLRREGLCSVLLSEISGKPIPIDDNMAYQDVSVSGGARCALGRVSN